MELIIFLILTILFSLIKSLIEQNEKNKGKPILEPKYEKFPIEQKAKVVINKEKPVFEKIEKTIKTTIPQNQTLPVKENKTYEQLANQNLELSFEHEDLIKGVIMSEILDNPRFKKPYKFR
ncbi:hypothetical protein SAMN02745227_01011 [Anaerobranca californiensis DSM 14826]|jgi:hypothetical protein|uniref:Uncharacterized protein n=1 Tax=Anaerobranca californiensis DSM 14826 TaxID=1120989 RepID=A0A1M6N5B0_9FIRM|nr:hypothetical protein [Anaerobranca californiensis]SHJ90867.1 hypothetical protein SAMN02745227_01011 [Anaerobranca californiensis DSM 14826]